MALQRAAIVVALLCALPALGRRLNDVQNSCTPRQVRSRSPGPQAAGGGPHGAMWLPPPSSASPTIPPMLRLLQVHISLTGNPTEIRVSWKTYGSR